MSLTLTLTHGDLTLGPEHTYVDGHGKYRVFWNENNDTGWHNAKWDVYFPDSQLPEKIAEWHLNQVLSGIDKLPFNADYAEDFLVNFINLVRAYDPSLPQFLNWLNSQAWYQQAAVQVFVFRLAVGLAQHYELPIQNYTVVEVLGKVKHWLINSDPELISRVVFGHANGGIV